MGGGMTVSILIQALQAALAKHGDLEAELETPDGFLDICKVKPSKSDYYGDSIVIQGEYQ
jgi:hypothetical protein